MCMKCRNILLIVLGMGCFPVSHAADYNINDYGAVSGGQTIVTRNIQRAIDDCSGKGGGRVIVPAGIYLSGSLQLKSNVELHLESGAAIMGSTDHKDYPLTDGLKGLILGDNAENIAITGLGEINGNGKAFFNGDNSPGRPFLVMFRNSSRINLSGITLKNPAAWTLHLLHDDNVVITGIHLYSHVNFNNDGIDIDSRNVLITNCMIDTDDDALCFKSDSAFLCENVVVNNCILASNCNFIKMGTASVGGFKNISISNCVLRKASESNFRFWNKHVRWVVDSITGLSGIALEVVDGGVMDRITISNISMEGVQTPIFIRLGSRLNATGALKNVLISGITARTYSRIPSIITAVPGFYVENVVLRDIQIDCMGGGTIADVISATPEKEKGYPENRMFGAVLPAYGLFVRHVKNLFLDNVQLNLLAADGRPALYLEDAAEIKINHLKASTPAAGQSLIRLNQVSDLLISGYAALQLVPLFLTIEGVNSNNILLINNNFRHVEKVYTKGAEIRKNVPEIR